MADVLGLVSPGSPGMRVLRAPHLQANTPMEASSSNSAWDAEKDTDTLFANQTILEIQQLERKTRLDISRKKEDLRQLVGERYRDLIEAADSIVDMKTCCEKTLQCMTNMEQSCQSLQKTHFLRGSGGMTGPLALSKTHVLAAEMKVLHSLPEKMWACLEAQRYLDAAKHFLFAQHIFEHLKNADPSSARCDDGAPLLVGSKQRGSVHPVLHQLWGSVHCFKGTILECCRSHLSGNDVEEGAVVECLCAIVLLEGCSLRQVFVQFLVARKSALQMIFQKYAHQSVKSQVCHLVRVVRLSLVHMATIFCCHGHGEEERGGASEGRGVAPPKANSSVLIQSLQKVAESQCGRELSIPESLMARLPEAIRSYSPSLPPSLAEVPANVIHSSCEEWLNGCVDDVEQRVTKLLTHVSSIEAIAAIRKAVNQLLLMPVNGELKETHEDNLPSGSKLEFEWRDVCSKVLGADYSIWDTMIQPLLFNRVKAILTQLFGKAETHSGLLLKQLLDAFSSSPSSLFYDRHLSLYLWEEGEESGSEVLIKGIRRRSTKGVGGAYSSHDNKMRDSLGLKARACTPSVQSFCSSFGEILGDIVSEVSHYLESPADQFKVSNTAGRRSKKPSSFDLHGNGSSEGEGKLSDLLQQFTSETLNRFLAGIDAHVSTLQGEMADRSHDGSVSLSIDKLLFMARVCQSLWECCPSLQLLFTGLSGGAGEAQQMGGRGPAVGTAGGGGGVGSPVAQRLRFKSRLHSRHQQEKNRGPFEMLLLKSTEIYRLWSQWCEAQLKEQLRQHVFSELQQSSMSSTVVWEAVDVIEESESGEKVSSTIRVPSQASVYVSTILFALCQELARVGGHAIDRSVLVHLSSTLLEGAVQVHEELLNDASENSLVVPQNCVLQLLFNVRFFSEVLVVSEESDCGKRLKSLFEKLENYVDPFDLNVFLPYISANIEGQVQRSMVMLGILLSLKGRYWPLHSSGGKQRASKTSSQERHILIPLSDPVPRFPSLPVSTPDIQPLVKQFEDYRTDDTQAILGTLMFFHHL